MPVAEHRKASSIPGSQLRRPAMYTSWRAYTRRQLITVEMNIRNYYTGNWRIEGLFDD
jgi:hypothetical protein